MPVAAANRRAADQRPANRRPDHAAHCSRRHGDTTTNCCANQHARAVRHAHDRRNFDSGAHCDASAYGDANGYTPTGCARSVRELRQRIESAIGSECCGDAAAHAPRWHPADGAWRRQSA